MRLSHKLPDHILADLRGKLPPKETVALASQGSVITQDFKTETAAKKYWDACKRVRQASGAPVRIARFGTKVTLSFHSKPENFVTEISIIPVDKRPLLHHVIEASKREDETTTERD